MISNKNVSQHEDFDKVVEGVRYINCPLQAPRSHEDHLKVS